MKFAFLLFPAVALAACSQPDAVAEGANNTVIMPGAAEASASPTGGPPNGAQPESPPVAKAVAAEDVTIPAALQGRWGLAPRDCTSTLGDAKGLLVINDHELRFYESRAVPKADIDADASSIHGYFAFTGEGQEWTKYEALELQGHMLVRTESTPMASFTYARCG